MVNSREVFVTRFKIQGRYFIHHFPLKVFSSCENSGPLLNGNSADSMAYRKETVGNNGNLKVSNLFLSTNMYFIICNKYCTHY